MTTYYFVGGEREAFIAGSASAIAWTTASGRYDPDFSRGAVSLNATYTSYIHVPLNSPQAESYTGFMHYTGGNAVVNQPWFLFLNSSLTGLFRIMGVSGTVAQPYVQWQYWNGSAWVSVGFARLVPTSIIHKWDFEILIDDTVGFARAY